MNLGGSIRDVPYWAKIPVDVIADVIELKKQQTHKHSSGDTYEADEYTEENWLKQFGGIR